MEGLPEGGKVIDDQIFIPAHTKEGTYIVSIKAFGRGVSAEQVIALRVQHVEIEERIVQ